MDKAIFFLWPVTNSRYISCLEHLFGRPSNIHHHNQNIICLRMVSVFWRWRAGQINVDNRGSLLEATRIWHKSYCYHFLFDATFDEKRSAIWAIYASVCSSCMFCFYQNDIASIIMKVNETSHPSTFIHSFIHPFIIIRI